MKRIAFLVLPFALAVVPGCSSTSTPKGEAKPAPAAVSEPTPEEKERAVKIAEAARRMAGAPDPVPSDVHEEPWIIVTDEATGKKLQRIPKSPMLRSDGKKVRHTLLNPAMFSLDLVREDEKYYYVDAPPDGTSKPRAQVEKAPEGLAPIVEIPEGEYEVVAPKVSATRVRFEEKSEGLPTSGFWRTNMDVADLDGDGSPEIVTPPRLASGPFRVFHYAGGRWTPVQIQVEAADPALRFAYGGVAVADMNGDGKLDVLGIGHGSGPVVAYNLGGWKFRIESRGMPKEMTGRSIAAGDVDGDGRMDVVAVSDEPESSRAAADRERARNYGNPPREPNADPAAYVKGFDMRVFLGQPDGTFRESTAGLESACFGYTLSLSAKPPAGGAPYFVSGCRYQGGRALLYEWDAATKAFRHVGRGVVEEFAFHSGAAVGTYRGFPAAFSSYVKETPPARSRSRSGAAGSPSTTATATPGRRRGS